MYPFIYSECHRTRSYKILFVLLISKLKFRIEVLRLVLTNKNGFFILNSLHLTDALK